MMRTIALVSARKALERQPRNTDLNLAQAYAFQRAGQPYSALLPLDRAVTLEPGIDYVKRAWILGLQQAGVKQTNRNAAIAGQTVLSDEQTRRLQADQLAARLRVLQTPARNRAERERNVLSLINDYETTLARWQRESGVSAVTDPQVKRLQADRLLALHAAERFEDVVAAYEAMRRNGNTPPDYVLGPVASAWLALRKPDKAQALYLQTLGPADGQGLHPLDRHTLETGLVYAYLENDRPEQAHQRVTQMREREPASAELIAEQGQTAMDLHDWKTAHTLLNHLQAEFPRYPGTRRLQERWDQHNKAELSITTGLEKSTDNPQTGSGDLRLETLLSLPTHDPAWRVYAGIGRAQGNFDEGRAWMNWVRSGGRWQGPDTTLEIEGLALNSDGATGRDQGKAGARFSVDHALNDQASLGGQLRWRSLETPLRAIGQDIHSNQALIYGQWQANDHSRWRLWASVARFTDDNVRTRVGITGSEVLLKFLPLIRHRQHRKLWAPALEYMLSTIWSFAVAWAVLIWVTHQALALGASLDPALLFHQNIVQELPALLPPAPGGLLLAATQWQPPRPILKPCTSALMFTTATLPCMQQYRAAQRWAGPASHTRNHSQQTHLQPGRLADHFAAPGRIPHNIDTGIFNAGYGQNLVAGFIGNEGTHAAPGCSQCHLHINHELALCCSRCNLAAIHQAQVHDIDRNFRVVTGG